ncbi:MAG: energy-coupling factor transporter ATPase [Clostridia bacterium]|nr:energy-coupling factor transporter ATPase [Clostridia bacterium]MBR5767976.1 energy-coupling factor transporter ATPase [Clostridia bacterium]
MAFISVKNLSFSYDAKAAEKDDAAYVLKDVTLDIEKGSFVCVLGRNGSGKSTFAKLLNSVLSPTSGTVTVDGTDVSSPDMSEDEIISVRKKIGMVFQDPDDQLVTTIVEEDVAFGPENIGIDPAEIRVRVDEALRTVGMTEFASHSTHQLSGGQKQRIAVAGILAMEPECIVLDESTAMLDPQGRRDIMDTVTRLNKEKGITIIHITHNMEEAVAADRVLVIDGGRFVLDGAPREVFSNVEKLRGIGLDVPQVTELCHLLRKQGLDVPSDVIDPDEGADAVCDALNNKKYRSYGPD